MKCRVARWPRGLGDGHWPQVWDHPSLARGREKWLLLNNHTSLGKLGSAALGGQLRIETHECQVCWTGLTCDQGSGPVLRTYTGWKTLPPSTSLPVMGEIAGVNTASLGGYLRSTKTRARWAEGFHELQATCSTWRGMGSARLYVVQDSPCDDNTRPFHTGTVAARVNKDRAFRRTPGRRCQVCYWCIIEDSRKRQHHHRHLEHKDTKTCRETSGTNTRNGQVQMEHPWTL